MKRKRIKNLPDGQHVRCSFCKKNTANKQCVGYPHGGKTVCNGCYQELKRIEKENICNDYISLGEEQAYRAYRVF